MPLDAATSDGRRNCLSPFTVALTTFCELNGAVIDPNVLDEKGLERLTKKSAKFEKDGTAPEVVFGNIRKVLGNAIQR